MLSGRLLTVIPGQKCSQIICLAQWEEIHYYREVAFKVAAFAT